MVIKSWVTLRFQTLYDSRRERSANFEFNFLFGELQNCTKVREFLWFHTGSLCQRPDIHFNIAPRKMSEAFNPPPPRWGVVGGEEKDR